MICRYNAMTMLQKETEPDSEDEPTQVTPREVIPLTKPFSLITLLIHLLRHSTEPGITRTQLSTLTGWPTKRLTSHLRQLETAGVIRSQLKNYRRRFVEEYSLVERDMEVSIPVVPDQLPVSHSNKRLSDVAIIRRQLLLDLVEMRCTYDRIDEDSSCPVGS